MMENTAVPRSAWVGCILFLALASLLQERFPLSHFDLSLAIQETQAGTPEQRLSARLEIRIDGDLVSVDQTNDPRRSLEGYEHFSKLEHHHLLQSSQSHSWGILPLAMAGVRERLGLAPELRRLQHALDDKALPDGQAPGPLTVEISVRIHHVDDDGTLQTFTIPIQKGTAWPAS